MRVTVRRAVLDDMDFLVDELKQFSTFFGTKIPLFNEEHTRKTLPLVISDHLVYVAADEDGKQLGFIAGLVTPHFMNPSIITLSEMFWWVKAGARGTRAGALLLDAFLKWGEEHANWINFTLEHHSPVNPHCLEKRGFKLQERNFLKEIA